MSFILQLAHSLNRRDEMPNQELAVIIATTKNNNAVQELVQNLHNKTKGIQHDCIKVLYEKSLRASPVWALEHRAIKIMAVVSKIFFIWNLFKD